MLLILNDKRPCTIFKTKMLHCNRFGVIFFQTTFKESKHAWSFMLLGRYFDVITKINHHHLVGVGWGGGNLGVILVRVCEPYFKPYPIHILTYSYTALWLLVPIFAGYYTNITVNSYNTKRISSLEKSLSEKYVHIPGCQKNGAFHTGIQKNRAIHILFF